MGSWLANAWRRISCACLAIALMGHAARADVTSEAVSQAIRLGINSLVKRQSPDGSWPGQSGTTDLVALALLTAGERVDSPHMSRALRFTLQYGPEELNSTYAIALQTLLFAAADPEGYHDRILRNASWLVQAQQVGALANNRRMGSGFGSWSYNIQQSGGGDNSNTQYALLGLNAAREAGIGIPPQVWTNAWRYWANCQQADGGWQYKPAIGQSTASMTTAGVSSLVIAGGNWLHGREVIDGETIHNCGQISGDPALVRGINWIGSHFRVDVNFGGAQQWVFYYLYGLERAGRLTGLRYFGQHDWYREGAEQLVMRQNRLSGEWPGGIQSTSFALLFLAKGRAPILVHKLRHGPGFDWDNDPDDVRNLVDVVSRDWKHLLTWQVASPETASVEDLLLAPVVFLNGHEAPVFSAEAKKRLREYVEQGGFIFAEDCCSRPDFDTGFRQLIKQIFPEPEYRLRPLPPEHPIWRARWPLTPEAHRLDGIEFGCRTVVVYSPGDLSCYWNQLGRQPDNVAVIKARRVGQNVIDYATGRELPADKLQPRELAKVKLDTPKRGALQIAKLKHAGDWNVAPLAVPHLTSSLRERRGFDVVINHRELLPQDPNLVHYPLLYIHGRAALAFGEDDLSALRRHLEPGGGTIFADAACGSAAFDTAFRKFAAALFPNHALEPIPANDELYGLEVGYDLSDVQLSKAAGAGRGKPQLEGVKINGHWAIIYSKYDIGCALERPQGLECKGYTHESALKIATNIVIYATLP